VTATAAVRRPRREPLQAKAVRYLAEARLEVLEVGPAIVRAYCCGDAGDVYRLGWWRGAWGCSCPAAAIFRCSCAHLTALRPVVPDPAWSAEGKR
jgi:hypothetical protein